ncbi:MAG: methyltransferase domain-containing protein [Aureispira sp.]|nr:methyltransferase domain-containing protein [Aureispira sp.]
MKTEQIDFWRGEFGKDYTERNSMALEEWEEFYIKNWGVSKLEINKPLLDCLPKDAKILEVGCNIGLQLIGLQKMGFTNLYGIELQHYAVEKSKQICEGINIIQGSGFDIPFKDEYFDLVCTNGVLIHIAPKDLPKIMGEIYRCSKKYIAGFEYYSEDIAEINYRGNKGFLWKADYSKLYQGEFNDLEEVERTLYPYVSEAEKGNTDYFYLLRK